MMEFDGKIENSETNINEHSHNDASLSDRGGQWDKIKRYILDIRPTPSLILVRL